MTHLSKAKEIVSSHKGDVFLVILVYVLMAVLQYLGAEYIPAIGWILAFVMSILSTIFLCYGMYRIARGHKTNISDLFSRSSTFMVDNFGKVIGAYFMYMLCLVPAVLVVVLTFLFFFANMLDAGMMAAYAVESYTPSITSMMVWGILFVLEIVALVIYCSYFNYRFLYKIMYYIHGRTPKLKKYSKDMLKMSFIQFLLACIPLVGFVLVFIWECFYMMKIALDVLGDHTHPIGETPHVVNRSESDEQFMDSVDAEFSSDFSSEFSEAVPPFEPNR